ncbi:MAG: NAD-dependent deacylase [Candidatus Sumerlaeales bacterium]|nr:NAD-dependent deacylase [Candidatus Sumerlaeales bacterium]
MTENKKKNLVVLTGAGISKESGIPTFRDSDGLWCGYNVEDVATGRAMRRNTKQVLEFFNDRRAELKTVEPNDAHKYLAKLEELFNVYILTQNIDNLHERAGSTHIVHLHGELTKASSMKDPDYVKEIGYDPINVGDLCPRGGQLRPFIVLFDEAVPLMSKAAAIASQADIFVVVGTSLVVYPAAGLVQYAPQHAPVYVVDPKANSLPKLRDGMTMIAKPATTGMKELYEILSAKK